MWLAHGVGGNSAIAILAVFVGAALGAFAALRNRARFVDERTLWTLGGAVGASAALVLGAAIATAAGRAPGDGAGVAFGIWASGSLLAALLTPAFDAAPARPAWLASLAIKAVQCPVSTLLGLLAAAFAAAGKPRLELRHGTLFAAAGEGSWALTLGAVVLAQRGVFEREGRPPEAIVRHESYHARSAACLGESGFYLTYLTCGALWARACRAPWNGLAHDGRGNPFERTAYALGRDPDGTRRA